MWDSNPRVSDQQLGSQKTSSLTYINNIIINHFPALKPSTGVSTICKFLPFIFFHSHFISHPFLSCVIIHTVHLLPVRFVYLSHTYKSHDHLTTIDSHALSRHYFQTFSYILIPNPILSACMQILTYALHNFFIEF